MTRPLTPVAYHRELRDTLRELEPGLWKWFTSDDFEAKSADLIRLELLKSTYRMQPAVHGELHAMAREVAVFTGPVLEVLSRGTGGGWSCTRTGVLWWSRATCGRRWERQRYSSVGRRLLVTRLAPHCGT